MIPSRTSRIVGNCPRRRSACAMVRVVVSVVDGSRMRATLMRPRHVHSMRPDSVASSRNTCRGEVSGAIQYVRSQFQGWEFPATLAMRSHASESCTWSRPRSVSMESITPYRIASHHPAVRELICTYSRRGARVGFVSRISAPNTRSPARVPGVTRPRWSKATTPVRFVPSSPPMRTRTSSLGSRSLSRSTSRPHAATIPDPPVGAAGISARSAGSRCSRS